MKPIRVSGSEQMPESLCDDGSLALEMTDDARRYAREAEREARAWAQEERRKAFRRDSNFARFLALVQAQREGVRR
jgi:hypothetical protein